jgi:hypothetical protein
LFFRCCCASPLQVLLVLVHMLPRRRGGKLCCTEPLKTMKLQMLSNKVPLKEAPRKPLCEDTTRDRACPPKPVLPLSY